MNNQRTTTIVILAMFGLFVWSTWNIVVALNTGFEPSHQSWTLSLLGGSLYAAWIYSVVPNANVLTRFGQLKMAVTCAFVGIASFTGVVLKAEPLLKPHQISSCYRQLEDKRTWHDTRKYGLRLTHYYFYFHPFEKGKHLSQIPVSKSLYQRSEIHRNYFKIDFIKYRLGSYRYSSITPTPKIEDSHLLHKPCL